MTEIDEIKLKSKFKNKDFIKITDTTKGGLNDNSSFIDELSLKDNSILDNIKKRGVSDRTKMTEAMIKEIKLLRDRLKESDNILEEKDNFINMLYQEIENIKKQPFHRDSVSFGFERSPEFNRIRANSIINSEDNDIEQVRKSCLENLEIIKSSLTEFLAKYDINEKVDFSSDVNDILDIRMKEIKYLIVNLRKINIWFKRLIKEFVKNCENNMYELNITIEDKIDMLGKKILFTNLLMYKD